MRSFLKILLFSLSFVTTNQSLASDYDSFTARSGPTSLGVYLGQGWGQLSMSYKGYLYQCGSPHYEVEKVKVLFIFHGKSETKILHREMGGRCASPWNYNAGNSAEFGRFESSNDDPELWLAIRDLIYGDDLALEVAFEKNGRWDSDFGRNFKLSLRQE